MTNDESQGCATVIVLFLIVALLIGSVSLKWYRAGVQSEVYDRAGVKVSQWECFIGAKPAERAVILK